MRTPRSAGTFVFAALFAASALAADPTPPRPKAPQDPAKPAAEAEQPKPSPEETAVREAAAAFVKAYNAGDAKAAAELFAENGEIQRDDDAPIRGRAAIQAAFQESFDESPGETIELSESSIRFITSDLAVEEGTSVVTPAPSEDGTTGEPVRSRYTVHYAKVDGKWLQASVRDIPDREPTVEDRLAEISWLLGEWVDEGEGGLAETVGRMDPSGKYIIRDFKITLAGMPAMSGTERIGWDPLSKQIKSWTFDARGGYGEALWTKTDNGWILKARGVTPEGQVASATRFLTWLEKDRILFRWSDRVAGGSTRPDAREIIMVRKPPAPAARGGKADAPAEKTENK